MKRVLLFVIAVVVFFSISATPAEAQVTSALVKDALRVEKQARKRDARRLKHLAQVSTGIARYRDNNPTFPVEVTGVILGGPDALCLSSVGFSAECVKPKYVRVRPNITPNGGDYVYISDGTTYSVSFVLESGVQALGLPVGFNVFTEAGFQ